MSKALEIRNLNKKYKKGKCSLCDISLTVDKSDVFIIVGESGSGKTTLLRTIAGLEEPNEGEIIINNNCVYNSNTFVKPESRKIGMVFQDYALFPHLSIIENILYGVKYISPQ